MRILREDTAALIVDYQEKLVPAMYKKEELVENTVKLLQGLKALEIPCIVTQQYTKGLGMTVGPVREALGENFKFYDKKAFSCMDEEEIKAEFEELGKKNVLVCGMEGHICVLQSIIDLKDAGYQPVLVTDCCSSRKEEDKICGIERAKQEGALLTTFEAVLFEMTRKSGTPVFKEISKIIK